MANSTYTLLNSLEFCKKFVYNRQLSLGDFKEPLLTSANLIKQTIVGPPFVWRWNRVITGFVCRAGVQDYRLGNWTASTALPLNFYVVDSNGNSQRVTIAGTTGGSLPSWNASTSGTTVDNTVTWTNMGPILNASSTYTFGWIENGSVQDLTGSKWFEMSPKIDLALDSSPARPVNISAQIDNGDGSITFRLMPVPTAANPVSLTIQQKASLFTSINQTWSPIPDEYSYIYQWGMLFFSFLFADDPRSGFAAQKFAAHLLGAAEGLTDTEKAIFLNQWQAISGSPVEKQIQLNQGNQARGSY